MSYAVAEGKRLTIYAKPLGRCEQLFIDQPQKSGLYIFLKITILADIVYKPVTGTMRKELLIENSNEMLARTLYGPLD